MSSCYSTVPLAQNNLLLYTKDTGMFYSFLLVIWYFIILIERRLYVLQGSTTIYITAWLVTAIWQACFLSKWRCADKWMNEYIAIIYITMTVKAVFPLCSTIGNLVHALFVCFRRTGSIISAAWQFDFHVVWFVMHMTLSQEGVLNRQGHLFDLFYEVHSRDINLRRENHAEGLNLQIQLKYFQRPKIQPAKSASKFNVRNSALTSGDPRKSNRS